MLDKYEVVDFFLAQDKANTYFNKKLVQNNGRTFYEGNARLNKMLHLAHNIYIAKTGQPLIGDDFYAYDNGAVIPEIQENYGRLLASPKKERFSFDSEKKDFLAKIFFVFKDAPLDELIALDHEDPEWKKRNPHRSKAEQKMNSMANVSEYQHRYKDIVKVMDRMENVPYVG